MKRYLILSAMLTMLFAATGCLKDKSFDEHKYGFYNNDTKSIGFIQARTGPVSIGITGRPEAQTVAGPVITIDGTNQPAASALTINIEENPALIATTQFTPLPQGTYSLNMMTATIAAGDTMTRALRVSVSKSDELDPNITYAIAYTIKSVDGGYGIARNLRNVIIAFTIKNKYDGVYLLEGYHNRPTLDFPYETEVELVTVGPNEVVFYWPEVNDFGHPIGEGPNNALSWYGNTMQPVVVFDPASNAVTNVYNRSTGAPITMFTGAGSRPGKFDPADRSITVDWNYNNNPQRAFFDDLTFIRERD